MLLLFHERGLHMYFHCFSWLIFLTSSAMCMNTIYIRYLLPKHIFLGVPPNILKFPTGLLKKARGTRVVETIFPLPKCRVSFFMYNCFHKSGYKSYFFLNDKQKQFCIYHIFTGTFGKNSRSINSGQSLYFTEFPRFTQICHIQEIIRLTYLIFLRNC